MAVTGRIHTVRQGSIVVNFTLTRSHRKTLGITVSKDPQVQVAAPRRMHQREIYSIVADKARWIDRKLKELAAIASRWPSLHYIDGEQHLYLGKQYRLRIVAATEQSATITGQHLELASKQPLSPKHTKRLLFTWYDYRAKEVFPQRLRSCFSAFQADRLAMPTLKNRRMRNTWGTMNYKPHRMLLNTNLIRARVDLIDYVIFHELCHILHANHSSSFYSLLEKVWPTWQQHREELEHLPRLE